GEFATSLGYRAIANGIKSIAIGAHYHVTYDKPVWEWSTTLGKWIITTISTEVDRQTIANGEFSISIGNGNQSNNGGLSIGTNNDALAFGSVAIGHSNVANGDFSFAAGFGNNTNALKSFAFGEGLDARSTNSFVVGAFNKIEGTAYEWFDKEPLFVVGNGHPANRSNAFAVLKDGNIVLSENLAPNTSGVQLYYDPVDHLMKKEVSSIRYKTGVEPLNDIEWLYNLNPVRFSYISDPGKNLQYGLIAEEMVYVNKNLVVYNSDEPESINYNGLFAPMIKAIQDQKMMINDLQVKNTDLSEENRELRMRLEKLEEKVSGLKDSE
ncbi:MAG: trimeric autotransporter adhesin, partial [Bacteroidota bacterium]|nr:trimeric autotransporter adhesin [Bacteroidota bacterium]